MDVKYLCLIIDECTRELYAGILTSSLSIFHTFFSILVYIKCLVLIQAFSKTIVDLK